MSVWSAVPPESIVNFPEGIPGLAGAEVFVILRSDELEPIAVLQSLEDERVSLPVIPIHTVAQNYRLVLTADDRETLQAAPELISANLVCLAVLILPVAGARAACNLLAPIVINPSSMRGKQIVQVDSGYSAFHPLEAA